MANNKIVDREVLKTFRQKLDERYAKPNGYYPTMTVGLADNFTPYSEDSGAEQTNPFISNGTGTNNNTEIVTVGDYGLLKEKQGNTLVVNQWQNPNDFEATKTVNGITFTKNNDGSVSVSGTSTNVATYNLDVVYIKGGNEQYFLFGAPATSTTTNYYLYDAFNGHKTGANGLINAFRSSPGNVQFQIKVESGITISTPVVFKPKLIDLTQMFNGDIPQDLLDNPSHFSWYYNGSLDYNTGSLENANGVKLVSTKRNIWDEETEVGGIVGGTLNSKNYIEVIPNATYYYYCSAASSANCDMYFYDKDKNQIGIPSGKYNQSFTIPSNCFFIRFRMGSGYGTTYKHDITISLYYTPAEGGEGYNQYYPYEEPYVVDTGNEVLRKAGNVHDIKLPSGEIKRNVGVVDLGTLSWNYSATYNSFKTNGLNSLAKFPTNYNMVGNALCQKYVVGSQKNVLDDAKDKTICLGANYDIWCRDSAYTDAQTFQTAMSGVYLFYELAEPTTEQGTPFAENLPINDYGVLYWLDSENNLVGIPQGAKIFYPTNYKGFVDDMYSRVEGDSSKYVIDSELSASESARDSVDTQLKNAIGGTLRQCLCVKGSLDFDNTKFIDLSTLDYAVQSNIQGLWTTTATIGDIKASTSDSSASKILSTLYKTLSANDVYTRNVGIAVHGSYIWIYDNSVSTNVELKNKLKGVLLAYEKA